MDKVILGILLLKNMTIYDIRNVIKRKFGVICSDSMGSIQAAIKKLVASDMLAFTEFVENGKNKKVYAVTDSGREHFMEWLSQSMDAGKGRNMELSRLFFMGLVPTERRLVLVDEYIAKLKQDQSYLQMIYAANVDSLADSQQFLHTVRQDRGYTEAIQNLSSQDLQDILTYQMFTLQFSMDSLSFEIQWYENLKKKLKGGIR